MDGRAERRRLLLLFAVSLVVRLAAVGVMVLADARPAFDEFHYVQRADAWASLIGLNDAVPDSLAWDRAYDEGFQPPLHPLTMGVATTGRSLPGAGRVWNALLTALATPLVYLLARRLVDRRAAFVAAWLHVLHPTVSFFAASLWAEPLYVLLMLAAVERTLAARDAPTPESRLRRGLAAGAALGLLLLTRTAALPWAVVLPLILLGRPSAWNARRKEACVLVLAAVLTIAPWQVVLLVEEDRPALLATSTGWNLALGNNPHVGPGEGSTWVGPVAHERLRAEAGDDPAGYALHHVASDPGGAIVRALDRLRLTWAADLFPTRHVAHALVRPGPAWIGAYVWATTAGAYLVLMALAVFGLMRTPYPHRRAEVLTLTAAACLGPLLTVAFPRLHFPLLILLLPAAAVGWTRFREPLARSRRIAACALTVLLVWATVSSLGPLLRTQMLPSAGAASWIGPVADMVGEPVTYADQVEIVIAPTVSSLRVTAADGLEFTLPSEGKRARTVTLTGDGGPEGRRLFISLGGGPPVDVDPLAAEFWRRRVLLDDRGLPGVALRWLGGGMASDRKETP